MLMKRQSLPGRIPRANHSSYNLNFNEVGLSVRLGNSVIAPEQLTRPEHPRSRKQRFFSRSGRQWCVRPGNTQRWSEAPL